MNRFSLLLILATLILSAACSSKRNQEVVSFSGIGESSDTKDGKVRFDNLSDAALSDSERGKPGQTETFEGNDNSKITVRWDKFGNKTTTRVFAKHPRLASIFMVTRANGLSEAFIYGHGGKTVYATKEILDSLLTATADELANAAKIYQTYPQGDFIYTQKPPVQSDTPLKPLPSSEFPVNNRTAEPEVAEEPAAETESPTTDTAEQKPAEKQPEKPETGKVKSKDGEDL